MKCVFCGSSQVLMVIDGKYPICYSHSVSKTIEEVIQKGEGDNID